MKPTKLAQHFFVADIQQVSDFLPNAFYYEPIGGSLFRMYVTDKDGNLKNQQGGGAIVGWDDIQDKPLTFPPSAHTHEISEVNQLPETLQQLIDAINNAGNELRFVNTAPDNAVGIDGDVWWRTGINQIYKRESGAYVLKVTIESSSGGGLTEEQVQGLIDASITNFETTTQLNARDTANRDRENHTGTQDISTVSGLQEQLEAKALDAEISLVGKSNNYNDLDNKPTIPTLITDHSELNLDDGSNPHGTTKSDVGLSNVDNTSDADKPISTATGAALATKLEEPVLVNSNTITFEANKHYGIFNSPRSGNLILSNTPTRRNGRVAWVYFNDSVEPTISGDTFTVNSITGVFVPDETQYIVIVHTLQGNVEVSYQNSASGTPVESFYDLTTTLSRRLITEDFSNLVFDKPDYRIGTKESPLTNVIEFNLLLTNATPGVAIWIWYQNIDAPTFSTQGTVDFLNENSFKSNEPIQIAIVYDGGNHFVALYAETESDLDKRYLLKSSDKVFIDEADGFLSEGSYVYVLSNSLMGKTLVVNNNDDPIIISIPNNLFYEASGNTSKTFQCQVENIGSEKVTFVAEDDVEIYGGSVETEDEKGISFITMTEENKFFIVGNVKPIV